MNFSQLIELIQCMFSFLTFIVLSFTLFFVWKYTKETIKIRKKTHDLAEAAKKQLNFSIRPLVSINESVLKDNYCLELKNNGNGVALNIKIKAIGVFEEENFKQIDSLPPGEYKKISFDYMPEPKREKIIQILSTDYWQDIDDTIEYGGEFGELNISYQDLDFKKYETILIISADGYLLKELI